MKRRIWRRSVYFGNGTIIDDSGTHKIFANRSYRAFPVIAPAVHHHFRLPIYINSCSSPERTSHSRIHITTCGPVVYQFFFWIVVSREPTTIGTRVTTIFYFLYYFGRESRESNFNYGIICVYTIIHRGRESTRVLIATRNRNTAATIY